MPKYGRGDVSTSGDIARTTIGVRYGVNEADVEAAGEVRLPNRRVLAMRARNGPVTYSISWIDAMSG
jgi:hypothetical protein